MDRGPLAFFIMAVADELDAPIEKPEDDDEEQLFILNDVRVDTLGLVERGAVDESFFLLKNQGGAMADEGTLTAEAEAEGGLSPLEQLGTERLQKLIDLGRATEKAGELEKASKIGTFLRQQREKKEMSVQDVAGEMSITAGTVRALENGEHLPSAKVIGEFAKVLGVSADRLQGMMPSGAVDKADSKRKRKRPVHKNLSTGAARGVRSLLSTYGDELPDDVVGMLGALLEATSNLTDGSEEKTEKDQSDEVDTMSEEEIKADQQAAPEAEADVTKTDQQPPPETTPAPPDPALLELIARLEKSEETHAATLARLEKAEGQVAKAQEEARQEREARQRIVHIEKAREFGGLGIKADEMGGYLHKLAIADQTVNVEKAADAEDRSDLYGYFTNVLKAANEQIIETGFYEEVGNSNAGSQNGATLLEKAEAAVDKGTYPDLATALINASPEEAKAYQAKRKE